MNGRSNSDLVSQLRHSRRRGKEACLALAKLVSQVPSWKARIVPVSGAGKMGNERVKNVWADVEAFFHGQPSIMIAFEVKTTRRKNRRGLYRKLYIERPVQVQKLFATMNIVPIPKRYAVFAGKFGKKWRFLMLHSFHAKLNYIGLSLYSEKGVFKSLDDLLMFVEADTRVYFPVESEKTELGSAGEKAS